MRLASVVAVVIAVTHGACADDAGDPVTPPPPDARPDPGPPRVPGSGPAREFARVGFAGVQVDGPLGGLRNTTGGDGSSAFSETLSEHNRAVQRYQLSSTK